MNGERITCDRDSLSALSTEELARLKEQLEQHCEKLETRLAREELIKSLGRRRAVRIAGDTMTGSRLDVRIERLFESLREGREPWPIEEAVRVVDGIVGRIMARRLWIGVLGLLTVVPALASLYLLASQNSNMIRKVQIEEGVGYRRSHVNFTEILLSESPQVVVEKDGANKFVEMPSYHRRLRSEAFSSLIALEKKRWSADEREALPPVRYINFRNSDLHGLTLGNTIGLEEGALNRDFSRLLLDNSDLTDARLLNGSLDGSRFRNVRADRILIVSPSAKQADFTGMSARGASFEFSAGTEEPFEMEKAVFDMADLTGSTFRLTVVQEGSFEATILEGVSFDEAYFIHCDFTRARFGEKFDWTGAVVHKCAVTGEQVKSMVLPDYCYFDEEDGDRRIMCDYEKYESWRQAQMEKLQKAADEEMKRWKEEGRIEDSASGGDQ